MFFLNQLKQNCCMEYTVKCFQKKDGANDKYW